MSLDVMQSFAKAYSDLVSAHDAANGSDLAAIPIRPVVGDLNANNEGVGMYLDNQSTSAYFGGGGGETQAILHFVISSPEHSRVARMVDLLRGLDLYHGRMPYYDVVAGVLRRRAAAPSSFVVYNANITGVLPNKEDSIYLTDVAFRVSFDTLT